ncbi:polysaccharide deacetylase family protein [Burkholderia pyrrocinia]
MSYSVLTYHQICRLPPRADVLRSLSVDPREFRRQMTVLKTLGYRGCSVTSLQHHLLSARRARVFGIAFDDGFLNVFDHAMPVLDELGFTATCYFVSGKLGGSNDWDRHLDTAVAPLMDRGAMLEWASHGHEVGAHTVDHVVLPEVPLQVASRQIAQSKEELERATGRPVESFCYPYGAWNPAVRDLVAEIGFTNATTTVRGRVTARDDPFLLSRVCVPGGRGLVRFLTRFYR